MQIVATIICNSGIVQSGLEGGQPEASGWAHEGVGLILMRPKQG